MALRWETELVREQAARLLRRRTHRGLGPRLEEAPSRGEALLAWPPGGALEGAAAACERAAARVPAPVEGSAPDLRAALERCQRPFQLWNVPRAVVDHPFELREEPALGGAGREDWRASLPPPGEALTAAREEWRDLRAAARARARPPMGEAPPAG
jgi:hypothetical protein